jgi:hypothetical protein
VTFLVHVKEAIEDPQRLLLEVEAGIDPGRFAQLRMALVEVARSST